MQNERLCSTDKSSTNFANAYYGDGMDLIDDYMNKLHKTLEARDHPECIQMVHSLAGGTGIVLSLCSV